MFSDPLFGSLVVYGVGSHDCDQFRTFELLTQERADYLVKQCEHYNLIFRSAEEDPMSLSEIGEDQVDGSGAA